MSKFIYFTEEEIKQASQVDLVDLLRSQHEKLKKSVYACLLNRSGRTPIEDNAENRRNYMI